VVGRGHKEGHGAKPFHPFGVDLKSHAEGAGTGASRQTRMHKTPYWISLRRLRTRGRQQHTIRTEGTNRDRLGLNATLKSSRARPSSTSQPSSPLDPFFRAGLSGRVPRRRGCAGIALNASMHSGTVQVVFQAFAEPTQIASACADPAV
jgi:hypothetical protein